MTTVVRTRLFPSLPALALAVLVVGCGDGKGYRLQGKVTFKGQPVAAGRIYFSPDGSKGNSGASGFADIKAGVYDTSASGGRGFGGGPAIIAIEGYDPSAAGGKDKGDTSGEVTIKALFPRYEFTVDLAKESQTKDFDVPAEAATRQPNKKETGEVVP
ncbi:hypothetical protein [Urbifossiella limnaea]|uniref:Carboxypeptidase regulatory-like domain-containing protein n=1 Tax=Urbifossiella limnaea TaxID=2528023 RepID=A0A517XY44_9BACT|nr:hypothetical protein [Urbifossiella limnaea]QDU22450.1 hypothetical protein ETAA1_44300 [Urbifossiella limnaea]